mmetsp:Transcript_7574/g.8256  ORF Transcript_7574/g.8256 Transcript_7574/m.8256 type:complete len:275 (+) Transcript_7574:41-865(+)
MTFITFMLTFTIFMMVLTSSAAKTKFPKGKSRARGLLPSAKHSKEAKKPSLRSRSRVSVKESPIIKMYGYFEIVLYANGDCTNAVYKGVLGFNICTLSADPDHSEQYTKATVYAYPEWNYYEIDAQYFSDSACTNLLSTDYTTLPILICDDSQLDHVISKPLSPTGDNLGYTFLLYDTQSNCLTNNYQVGVMEAEYGILGTCIEGDSSTGEVDSVVSSCNSNQVVINSYTSTDGSCSGTVTSQTVTTADVCENSDDTLLDNYLGYSNFGCASQA